MKMDDLYILDERRALDYKATFFLNSELWKEFTRKYKRKASLRLRELIILDLHKDEEINRMLQELKERKVGLLIRELQL